MIEKETVCTRISHIRESISLLMPILSVDPDEYAQNPDHYLKAERLMEIIAQAMIDICTHVAAAKGLPKAETYHGLVDILADHKLIPERFRAPFQSLFGLRNILAHQYLVIDRARFQQEVKTGIADIEAFCREVARLACSE